MKKAKSKNKTGFVSSIIELGLECLASDRLMSIFLINYYSPVVRLESEGLNGKKYNIHFGMSIKEFEELLSSEQNNYRFDKILSNKTN